MGSRGQDRAYLGTDSRIFEPLAGALLAVLMTSASVRALITRAHWRPARGRRDRARRGRWRRSAARAARRAPTRTAARSSSPRARRPSSPRSRREAAGDTRARAACGRLPRPTVVRDVPVALAACRSGPQRYGWWDLSRLGTPVRASVLTVLTVALAALSYHLIETPIRYGTVARFLVPRRMFVVVPLALGALFLINSSLVLPRAGAAHRTGDADDRARRRFGSAAARPGPGEGRCPPRLRRDLRDPREAARRPVSPSSALRGSPGAPG